MSMDKRSLKEVAESFGAEFGPGNPPTDEYSSGTHKFPHRAPIDPKAHLPGREYECYIQLIGDRRNELHKELYAAVHVDAFSMNKGCPMPDFYTFDCSRKEKDAADKWARQKKLKGKIRN